MPCLVGCFSLLFPRIVFLCVLIFSPGYIEGVFQHRFLMPLLGFLFMPLTTLAYAWAMNSNGGNVNGIYLVVVIVAVLADLGMLGGGGWGGRRRYRKVYIERGN